MEEETSDSLDAEANKHGLPVVGAGEIPAVRLDKNLANTARRLGELMGRLELFELNGDLIYFDHKGQQKLMTSGAFRTWINEHVHLYTHTNKEGLKVWTTLSKVDAGTILETPCFLQGVSCLLYTSPSPRDRG